MTCTQFFPKFLFPLIGLLLLFGCAKDDSLDIQDDHLTNFAGLAVFNGVEGSLGMQLKIDGNLFNKDSERFAIGEFLNHRTVFPGKRAMEVRVGKTAKAALMDDFEFEASKLYTFFFYGRESVDYLITEDDLLRPEDGHTRFRVVNLVDDAKMRMDVQSPSGSFSHHFNEPVREYEELPAGSFAIKLAASNNRYAALELSFQPEDYSINTLVIYTDWDTERSKHVLRYKLIELRR
ncbi:MAG: DUF4397 domain-containing protein [Sphingobacterium sp.]